MKKSKKSSSPPNKRSRASDPQKLVPKGDVSGPNAAFVTESYNKVARAAKLEGLVLTGSDFIIHPNYYSPTAENGAVSFSYDASVDDEIFDAKSGLASCAWTWTVEGKLDDEIVVRVRATYRIFYSELTDCEETAVKRFMNRVGRFATYPYFRAHVSQTSWESSAQLPLLPTIAS